MSINRDHARLMRRATAGIGDGHPAGAEQGRRLVAERLGEPAGRPHRLAAGRRRLAAQPAGGALPLRPADDDHRYGHGKAEALAGLGQAAFICVSAILVGVQGVDRLLHPQPLGAQGVGIAVMIFSLVMTAVLLTYQHHVVKITGSTAVRADSLHYRSDLLLNSSILLALVLASFGWERTDALFGIAIAFTSSGARSASSARPGPC